MEQISPRNLTYLCNPDVVLREEDEEGALLFNPDTNQVKVVNITGLFIWQQFMQINEEEKVAECILENFEGADAATVKIDLHEFLADMIASGFIGEVH